MQHTFHHYLKQPKLWIHLPSESQTVFEAFFAKIMSYVHLLVHMFVHNAKSIYTYIHFFVCYDVGPGLQAAPAPLSPLHLHTELFGLLPSMDLK